MFILGGCLDAPMFVYPYICMPPWVYMPPICPHTCLCLHVGLEALHVVGGCNGLPFVLGHPPYIGGCLPLTPPTLSHWGWQGFPVHWYVQGHQYVIWTFPSVSKGLGVFPPSVGGWRGHQHLRCPYAHSCTFFSALCFMF